MMPAKYVNLVEGKINLDGLEPPTEINEPLYSFFSE